MSSSRRRTSTCAILAAVGLGVLATMAPAGASVRGRRTTAAVLGAVAAYQLIKGHTTTGLLAAGGAAYAYKRTQDAQKAERRDAWRYRDRYYGSACRRPAVRGYRSRDRHHRYVREREREHHHHRRHRSCRR